MYKILFTLVVFVSILFSQFNWQDGGLPLRQGAHIEWQRTGAIANDGSMLITWSDTRNSIRDIYAQKIDSDGNFLWDENGSVVVDVDGRQEDPLLVPDNDGGAYIIWRDYRDENYYGDIYAQHIDSNGNQLWDIGGVPLSNQSGSQVNHNLCVDGIGGAFAVWADMNGSGTYRGTHLGSSQSDILTTGDGILLSNHQSGGFSLEYAGDSSAVMVWGQGVTLDTYECLIDEDEDGYQDSDEIYFSLDECLSVCGDYNEDGIVNYLDCDSGSLETGDIRAQRFNMDMESLWNEDDSNSGKVICDDEYIQTHAKVTTFGDNVIVVWRDLRNDDDGDVYAQILDPQGNSLLEENGVVVCDDEGQQVSPRVKTDGVNAFIYWEDKRDDNVDPYVQKMDQDGNLTWTNNGVQLANDINNQDQVRMAVDSNGGAFFVWMDGRGENNPIWSGTDIYLEHIDSQGNLTFGQSGISIDDDSGPQFDPLIKCNTNGESFIVWSDQKDGSNIGIEVQVVTTNGLNLESNGKEIWYGVDGNALLSSSINIADGEYLVAWEDNRFQSSGQPGSFTYGLIVEENMNLDSHENSTPLSLNPFQGPHGGNYYYRAKLANIGESIMMNFHEYNGPYMQHIQMLDNNLTILGDDQGTPVDNNGEDQKFSDLCAVNEDFYLAYSSLISYSSYGIYLDRYSSSGESLWGNPINIVEGSFADNLVEAIVPNTLNNGVAVIYQEASFMGISLNIIFISEDGGVLAQFPLCSNCENPKYESNSIGDNEFIVLYTAANSEDADLYAQVFSFTGEMLGDINGIVISNEIRDQRYSDITYSSLLDEYLACWTDGRDIFLNDEGIEVSDNNILCSKIIFDSEAILSDEISVAYIQGSAQQNPSVFSTHTGTYMIAWEDMRSADDIEQSLNLSFEWDAFYQELDSNGPVYQDGGIPLSIDPFGQVNIKFGVLSEEDNLYLAFWEDDRSTGKELLTNLYAQLISPSSASDCLTFDVNADGNIDILDVIQMVNMVLGNLIPDEWQECASDANGDESIDILDVIQAVQFILNS